VPTPIHYCMCCQILHETYARIFLEKEQTPNPNARLQSSSLLHM
jgi:hypothetical protein